LKPGAVNPYAVFSRLSHLLRLGCPCRQLLQGLQCPKGAQDSASWHRPHTATGHTRRLTAVRFHGHQFRLCRHRPDTVTTLAAIAACSIAIGGCDWVSGL